jgi:hypothetical protein
MCNNAGTHNALVEGERISHLVCYDVISCAFAGSRKVGHETLKERGPHYGGGAEIAVEEKAE